jgi:Protein of unknown function (DUF3105)
VAKSSSAERRARVEQLRATETRTSGRSILIVGLSGLVALALVGSTLWFSSAVPYVSRQWWDNREFQSLSIEQIGAPASACGQVTTKKANGNNDHVPEGTPMTYPDSPPAFGTHWGVWETMDRKFYTAQDRPALGKLVHNLEHGYTLLWYDDTIATDSAQMADVEAIADKYAGTDNMRLKFKAVPWTADDGDPFPDGQHVALTHWSNGGVGQDATGVQEGVWQYCSAPSGAALKSFMEKYPYLDSPEPNAM